MTLYKSLLHRLTKSTAPLLITSLIVISTGLFCLAAKNNLTLLKVGLIGWAIFWAFFAQSISAFLITTTKRQFIDGYYNQDHLFNILSKTISTQNTPKDMLFSVETLLRNHLHYDDTGVITLDRTLSNGAPVATFTYHPKDAPSHSLEMPMTSALFTHFSTQMELCSLNDLPENQTPILTQAGCTPDTLLIPFRSLEGFEGLILLGKRHEHLPLKEVDLNFFKTIQTFVGATFHMTMPYEKLDTLVKTQLEVQGILKTVVTLSHEINSPLASLHLGLRVLEKESTLPDTQKTVLVALRQSLEKIMTVMKRMQTVKTVTDVEYVSGVRMVEVPKE